MRLKHLRELLKISEEYMADRLKISVEQYHELEESQGDQIVSLIEDSCEPLAPKDPDMFNTEPVLRRMLSTSNHAVQIQIEENKKLREENSKLKRSLVMARLTNAWSLAACQFKDIKLFEIDYWMLESSGITRQEADKLTAEIQEKYKEDDE